MDTPKISVVIATYNGAMFLAEQLESILAQTLSPYEVIISDDRSADATISLIEQYIEQYPQIILLKHEGEENLGYVGNFSKGMQAASGNFIALSDQDDIWLPGKLEKLYADLGSAPLVYSDSLLVNEKSVSMNKRMSEIRNQLPYNDCLMYAIGAWAPGHTMLFRRSLFSLAMPFPRAEIATHDFWLGFVATCNGGINYVNEPLVLYRQHGNNAIGADTHRANKPKPSIQYRQSIARERMWTLYEKCPATLKEQKEAYHMLALTYSGKGLLARWKRMMTFFRYHKRILAYKRKSIVVKWLFCIKMFFKIDY